MKIILINGSSTPLYEQIKNAVKENIVKNILAPDEQLPSVRQLSKELNVSILTVKKAYDELEKEGFIVVRQGLGTFVAPLNSELIQEEKQKNIEEKLIIICRMAKSINLSESELIDLIRYIYEGGTNNE
jgi:transcriptional regulator, GntR family